MKLIDTHFADIKNNRFEAKFYLVSNNTFTLIKSSRSKVNEEYNDFFNRMQKTANKLRKGL